MKLTDMLPLEGWPHAENRVSSDLRWCAADTEEAFRKNGGHHLYDESSITYRLNSQGYRCPEFEDTASIRMISIGCSHTFGVGLPQDALYHELFAKRLGSELGLDVINWNLGSGGASNNYIARLLHLTVPKLKPDLVLIFFSYFSRREYVAANNRSIKYLPKFQYPDPVLQDISNGLSNLTSEYDDQLSFFRDYKSIEALLAGRLWAFSFVNPRGISDIVGHLDSRFRTRDYRRVDRARDHSHLGPKTHFDIYECYWDWLNRTDGLEKLKVIADARLHSGDGFVANSR